jgi:hypothetical protein
VNEQVAIAGALGASWVTTSPFRQRLLLRRGGRPAPAQALIRAGVPQLSGASAKALARVAAEDETVEALRQVTRESLHAMRDLPPASQREAAAELGRKLEAKAEALRKDMARTRRWKLAAPGVTAAAAGAATTAAVAIGTAGPMAGTIDLLTGLASALATSAAALPYLADRASQHANPAFALVIGDGLATPRTGSRPIRHKPVATITAVMAPGAHASPEVGA